MSETQGLKRPAVLPQRSSSEHRRIPRARCELEAMVRSEDRDYFCLIDDVSPFGCRLSGIRIKDLADRVVVRILDQEAIPPMTGEVVWRRPDRVGVRFLHGEAAAGSSAVQAAAGAAADANSADEPGPAAA